MTFMRQTSEHEEPERIALVDGRSVKGLWAVCNVIGGVSGFISLMTVALLGGEIKRQVQVDAHRIDVLESMGSPSAQVLAKALSNESDIRRDADTSANKRADDIRADFGQRVANITGLLERLVDQQTQLISLIKVQNQLQNK